MDRWVDGDRNNRIGLLQTNWPDPAVGAKRDFAVTPGQVPPRALTHSRDARALRGGAQGTQKTGVKPLC